MQKRRAGQNPVACAVEPPSDKVVIEIVRPDYVEPALYLLLRFRFSSEQLSERIQLRTYLRYALTSQSGYAGNQGTMFFRAHNSLL